MAEHAEAGTQKKGKASSKEEEEVKLPVPDFNEEKFMRREIESAKLAMLNTAYGIMLAGIAVMIVPLFAADYRLGWITLIVGVAGLRLVYRAGGVAIHEWKTKEWIGAYFTLFFSFLAFWYIFSNPPFG